jgi:hypothetical protein
MVEYKPAKGQHGRFVQDVKAALSPQGILFFDWQLQDVVNVPAIGSLESILLIPPLIWAISMSLPPHTIT